MTPETSKTELKKTQQLHDGNEQPRLFLERLMALYKIVFKI